MPCPRTQQANLPACSPQPPLNAERQAGKLRMPFFKGFWYDSTRGMNPRSTNCEAGALTTTPSHRLFFKRFRFHTYRFRFHRFRFHQQKTKKLPLTIFFNFCGFVACLLLHFIILKKQKPSFTAITLPTSLKLIVLNYSVFVFRRYQNSC